MRAHGGSDIRDVNVNSENWAVVKAALVAGMYPNLAHVDQGTALLSSSRKKKLHFHPTSVLSQSQAKEVGARAPAPPDARLCLSQPRRGALSLPRRAAPARRPSAIPPSGWSTTR